MIQIVLDENYLSVKIVDKILGFWTITNLILESGWTLYPQPCESVIRILQ